MKNTAQGTGFSSDGVIPYRTSRDRLCKPGALCIYSSVVQVDLVSIDEMLRNPPERKVRKRWQQPWKPTTQPLTGLIKDNDKGNFKQTKT